MPNKIIQDRAAGAIMGAFIGDALGLGPHWYYDLAELRRDYGDGSPVTPIRNPADTTTDSRPANFPRPVSSSSSCFAPWWSAAVMTRRTSAAGWMKSFFRFSTEPRSADRAAIPASRSGRPGGGACSRNCPGGRPAAMRIHRSHRTHPCHRRPLCAAPRPARIHRGRKYHPDPDR